MYVTFPASTRDVLTLQKKYTGSGGLAQAKIKVTLGDGQAYDQPAKLDYVSPTVSNQTDTITLRATVPNPTRGQGGPTGVSSRELVDGEFVTVTVEDPHPVEQIVVPRSAVLSDQQGDYVFAVTAQNKAKRTNITQGESSGTDAVVQSGLQDGQQIVVDGLQRVHDGAAIDPKAPSPPPPDPNARPGQSPAGGTQGAGPAKAGDAAATQGSPAPPGNAAPSQR
jgi:membrane fusion protein (multidrug efflux system)